ncbi:hypothetical protein LTR78_002580 [Recurvomyces mirabilis]|uniref:Peroxisomal membrane protein PEX14 n=1 Tax=Recurvomyces mirabilis TaxID=574656 RepID=A0AAE1C4C4_9PEZI|nr:hypothetical protein LTR78_002580 [Recurvomyces mirabilis]KAK5157509.1 hypothetical protein LTS14_004274 [Recurvomyces mirabilis]
MPANSGKPSIPSWQRGKPSTILQAKQESAKEANGGVEDVDIRDENKQGVAEVDESTDMEDSFPPEHSDAQLEMVEAFLADPQVKDESVDKKRAFLESKQIPVETIDQVIKPKSTPTRAFTTADFTSFQQSRPPQGQPTQAAAQRQASANTPPIITYPEFLVEAHKPPPLITPGRLIGATYFAAGLATLFYGASNFFVKPMTDSLTGARHDFANHSQSKVDEFNERLRKIVSKVPEPHPALPTPEIEADDVESVTSDPTELYNRDMGTQTSPLPSRRSSDPFVDGAGTASQVTSVEHHVKDLGSISSHLNELTEGLERSKSSNIERKDNMTKLRHQLDMMIYGSPMSSLWGDSEDATKTAAKPVEHTAMDDLKKEIRGVKGVLLSARRFPGAGVGRIGS